MRKSDTPTGEACNLPNLYLVGFMGTGKSAVGRQLAQRLSMEWIDSDQAIEAHLGRTIPEIFATEGEAFFRQQERAFVESGHPAHGCVVSTGGGLVVEPGMSALLQTKGVVIGLFARPETILERVGSGTNRPMLAGEGDPIERITELLKKREPFYLAAGAGVSTDLRPMCDIVDHVERLYRRLAKAFQSG
ncbi:MAG: shikimate kinase [Opitutales bacterium]